ncbi:transferrin-binding protein-like solute binding protein [Nitratireductor sp. XY-223]|uniref:transferrin-binding protein-like solute binding protein n=1 Tax=Nitratireductor sp. XY-223 TaxID=2561926 RepID=UPI0010AACE1E|nr:transferrin-binding protein-like solute binding protein [Nitratireductor sp. XY-223]
MNNRIDRLLPCCTAALLSLGLAACNSTGTVTSPMNGNGGAAPTTELGKAQAAAKAAMEAAKTQSDAADTEADKAEAALTGLAMLQTGDPMAKTHADAARAAARAAMTAYNTAKAESAKAAAATTDTAAVEARIAAQAALKTAQAQQKIAMDKAAAAVKAAGMEVKVTYDDDGKPTYRVGEVTVFSDAEKKTMTVNGVERVTGKLGYVLHTRRTGRGAIRYQAANGETPERMAQPTIKSARLPRGSVIESADDSIRLVLYDKYVTQKTDTMVKVYKSGGPSTRITPTSTGEAPYGEHTADGNKYAIKRAEGDFYPVTGNGAPTKENLNQFTIAADAKGSKHIYYYEINGVRTYLELESSIVNDDGTTTFTFNKPAVVENVRFPEARSFEHLNYGLWTGLKEDGNTIADLGTSFVSKLPDGVVTPTGDMPNFGNAEYKGTWTANIRAAAPDGNGTIDDWNSGMTTTVDFGDNTLTTTLNSLAWLKGTIDDNRFSGTDITVSSHSSLGLDNKGEFTGEFSGNFFGPKAEEIGGVFDITSEGRKAGEARGAFGGRRTGTE